MTPSGWPAVLDAYEASLQAFSELTHDDDSPVLPEFVTPSGLEPLPEQHRERAEDLLRRSRELEAGVRRAKEQTARHLVLVGRTRTDRPGAAYLDRHA